MFNIPHGGDLLGAVIGCLGFNVAILVASSFAGVNNSRPRVYAVLILSYVLAVLLCYWINTVWS